MLDPIAVKSLIEKTIESPFDSPTDIIGFGADGKSIAEAIHPVIGIKEICFFDENIKSDPKFHYLDFDKMLAKTEIMIFTKELPDKYWHSLNQINQQVTIFIPKTFQKTISILIEYGYNNNLILL
jgi:hypothetical protein